MFFSAGRLVKFLTGYGAIGTMLAIISVTEPVLSAIVLNGLCVVIALHIALPVAAIAGGGMSALLGFRVFSIHLSSAPVRQRRIAGVAFAYGGPPFGAAVTFAGRSTKALRLRILLSMFAGFLTCIALATSALALSHGRGLLDLPTRVAPAGSFAMAAILLTIPSLEQMLNVARAKYSVLATMTETYCALEGARLLALQRYEEALPELEAAVKRVPDAYRRYLLGECLMRVGKNADAHEWLRHGLDAPELKRDRALVLNNIAWNLFVSGDLARLDEADRFSAEALAQAPKVSHVRGTRGAVLVALGRIDEALPLLEAALATNPDARSRAYNACCLAMAMFAQNDTVAAARYLATARELWSECPLLKRAPLPDARAFARVPGRPSAP